MKPRVLVYMPVAREVLISQRSMLEMDWHGFDMTLWFDREDNAAREHDWQPSSDVFQEWYERHARKLERARKHALAQGYDALMTIEDDILVPEDALQELWETDADIAYGLAVWRNEPHKWSATLSMEWGSHVTTYSDMPEHARQAWGHEVSCIGAGFFCTLIRRHVLEAVTFRRIHLGAADWALSADAVAAGFRQRTNTRVVCGHVDGETVYWPSSEHPFWRSESVAEKVLA